VRVEIQDTQAAKEAFDIDAVAAEPLRPKS